MEILRIDSILESPDARRFAKDPTTASDEVGGGEQLATMVGNSMEALGAMVRAIESLEAEVGATYTMPESRAQMS